MITKLDNFLTESVEYKYRFKTLQEFEKEGGDLWRRRCGFNTTGGMDYLIGTNVDVPDYAKGSNGEVVGSFNVPNTNRDAPQTIWGVDSRMLTMIVDNKPNYMKSKEERNKRFIRENIKTKKGSPIKRYKEVGKKMGNDLYIHVNYVDEYINEDFYNKLKGNLPKGVKFNIIKYNEKNKTISFINSPDFDTADEPIVSDAYKITEEGKVIKTVEKSTPQIYHHKWMFVKDDYKGFNVSESIDRSRRWLDVSDVINMSKIGSKGYWDNSVLPLIENNIKGNSKQEFTSAKTSIKQIPKPTKILVEHNELESGSKNLDIGGGKFNLMTNFLMEQGITNYIYDPFNKSKEHNNRVEKITKDNQSDSVTIFNVLNVIKEEVEQLRILKQAENAVKEGGKIYIYSDYKVKGKGAREVKGRDSYQQNYNLKETLAVVQKVFPDAKIIRKLSCIVVIK